VVAIVCAIVTILSAFKAAEMAAGQGLAAIDKRVAVTETKQQNSDAQLERLQRILERLENKVDRLLERER
jgi:hypothetical protein